VRALFCEACGAPLDAPWAELVVVCRHCGGQNLPGRPGGPVPASVPADGRPRLNLGGRTYVLESQLAEGSSARVYQGRWVGRLGERVVVKVLAALADAPLMQREWQTLRALHQSEAQGAGHYLGRLPAPVAHGLLPGSPARTATVLGWKSGFQHTLEEVGEALPTGVPGPVQVWLLKRLLELLGFVHRAGFAHGAVTPDHVLVHPRDHGATLVGWSLAEPWAPGHTRPLRGRVRAWDALYDGAAEASPALDVAMACRCARAVVGPLDAALPADAVGRVIAQGASGRVDDAWALAEALSQASLEVHGPPAWNPLPLPGWR
jgi:hypothetical protein